jgi:hypothetical protein
MEEKVMLVIRDFKRFCNRIAGDAGIDGSCGIVQDAVKDALRFYGNGARFYGGIDNEFFPPDMMEAKDFRELSTAIETIAESIRNDVEWEVRCGRDVIGSKKKISKSEFVKFKACPKPFKSGMFRMDSAKLVKKVNDEFREEMREKLRPESKDEGDHEFILENVARDAMNEARDMRQKFNAAKEENNDLRRQIVARNEEKKDAIDDSNPYMHVLLYEYAWSEIRAERDALYRTVHLGIAPMSDVYRAFEYISGLLDGMSAQDVFCAFADLGADDTSITWKNRVEGISTVQYMMTVEAAPSHIGEDDAVSSDLIADKFIMGIDRETFAYRSPTS